MDIIVKPEEPDFLESEEAIKSNLKFPPIDISSNSDSSSSSDDDFDLDDSLLASIRPECNRNKKRSLSEFDNDNLSRKKPKLGGERSTSGVALSPPEFPSLLPPPMPLYFVAPEPVTQAEPVSESVPEAAAVLPVPVNYQAAPILRSCRQFWKAGDYDCEGSNADDSSSNSVGMDHVRVHPKFLHSNATSHKWALGAFAELLDNSLDEVCNGATYVRVDTMKNKKDGTSMLLVEDNGGGMTPDKMRQCMSLGYSAKSKMANTIGQYGNGFKTSTMRLGTDVIVFSHSQGQGKSSTRSIGMLSYSFLMGTGKQDIVVPMIDYEKKGESWTKIIRSSLNDWNRNLETIVQWSPYTSEENLFQQFNFSGDHGTRIIIYNLWEDDEGLLELDFDSDPHDIQIRGVNRDEKNIEMAKKYPNSRHFLTYRHSLRSYASILYLRLPTNFRIILRGRDVEHHNLVNDMMLIKETTYKPQHLPDRVPKDLNMAATVTIGFVKDARHHIDIQGFNVYHKNRLIKPFWRVWNAAGSDGRGAIGVLEANFVEPAHDKQSFERTPVLSRLEARLVAIQKNYWGANCQEVGYAARRNSKAKKDSRTPDKEKSSLLSSQNGRDCSNSKMKRVTEICKGSPATTDTSEDESSCEASLSHDQSQRDTGSHGILSLQIPRAMRSSSCLKAQAEGLAFNVDKQQSTPKGDTEDLNKLKEKNKESRERLKRHDSTTKDDRLKRNQSFTKDDLQSELELEREKCRSLENQLTETQNELQKAKQRIEELDQEQIVLLDIIQEEREWRNTEEERLRNQTREASDVISRLVEKVRQLEAGKTTSCKIER